DRDKKALLEKNIGLALVGTGHLVEAIEHFNQALSHLGEKLPATLRRAQIGFAGDLPAILLRVYVRPRPRRKAVSDREREVCETRLNKARAQTASDPERFFFDSIASVRRLTQLNWTQIDQTFGFFSAAAALFVYSGVSYRVSRRFSNLARPLIREGNKRD